MQIDQFSGRTALDNRRTSDLNVMWDAVYAFQENFEATKNDPNAIAGRPPYISVRGGTSGHALVGYRTEVVDDMTGLVYVYDCNYPNSYSRAIRLWKDDPAGGYTHWSYSYYTEAQDGHSAACCVLRSYAPKWMKPGAGNVRSAAAQADNSAVPELCLLRTTSPAAEIYNDAGVLVARIVNGVVEALTEDVYPMPIERDADGPAGSGPEGSGLWLPVEAYTLRNLDEASERTKTTLVNVEHAATAVTSGDIVTLLVDDGGGTREPVTYVSIPESGVEYEIQLEDSTDPAAYQEVKISGTSAANPVTFTQIGEDLYADGKTPEDSGVTFTKRINGDVYNDIDLDAGLGDASRVDADGNYVPANPAPVPDPGFQEVPWTPLPEAEHPAVLSADVDAPIEKVHVTFQANGGTGEMADVSLFKGTAFRFPACGFTAPAGKSFDRWAVGSAGSADTAPAGEDRILTGSITLYALWKDGGSDTPVDPDNPSNPGTPSRPNKSSGSSGSFWNRVQKPETTDPAAPESAWTNPFTDVQAGDWFYDAVRFVNASGLMNGRADGSFNPGGTLSRAMAAQILYNKEGRSAASGGFTDVSGDAWCAGAAAWAKETGVVLGYEDGSFRPGAPVTREQFVTILWRYAGSPAPAGTDLPFTDASAAESYARDALCWAAEAGVLNGYKDGTLRPMGRIPRAQAAQLLKNYLSR